MKYVKNKINEAEKKKENKVYKGKLSEVSSRMYISHPFFFFLSIYSLYLRGLGLKEASYLSILRYF